MDNTRDTQIRRSGLVFQVPANTVHSPAVTRKGSKSTRKELSKLSKAASLKAKHFDESDFEIDLKHTPKPLAERGLYQEEASEHSSEENSSAQPSDSQYLTQTLLKLSNKENITNLTSKLSRIPGSMSRKRKRTDAESEPSTAHSISIGDSSDSDLDCIKGEVEKAKEKTKVSLPVSIISSSKSIDAIVDSSDTDLEAEVKAGEVNINLPVQETKTRAKRVKKVSSKEVNQLLSRPSDYEVWQVHAPCAELSAEDFPLKCFKSQDKQGPFNSTAASLHYDTQAQQTPMLSRLFFTFPDGKVLAGPPVSGSVYVLPRLGNAPEPAHKPPVALVTPKKQLPAKLKMRNVPFGSDAPKRLEAIPKAQAEEKLRKRMEKKTVKGNSVEEASLSDNQDTVDDDDDDDEPLPRKKSKDLLSNAATKIHASQASKMIKKKKTTKATDETEEAKMKRPVAGEKQMTKIDSETTGSEVPKEKKKKKITDKAAESERKRQSVTGEEQIMKVESETPVSGVSKEKKKKKKHRKD